MVFGHIRDVAYYSLKTKTSHKLHSTAFNIRNVQCLTKLWHQGMIKGAWIWGLWILSFPCKYTFSFPSDQCMGPPVHINLLICLLSLTLSQLQTQYTQTGHDIIICDRGYKISTILCNIRQKENIFCLFWRHFAF